MRIRFQLITLLLLCGGFVSLVAQTCPTSLVLRSQAEVDAFAANYTGCRFSEELEIDGSDITDLSPLDIIDTLDGVLSIVEVGTVDFDGFNGLRHVAGRIDISLAPGITGDLGGFAILETAGSDLSIGDSFFTTLSGFPQLRSLGNDLTLDYNEQLVEVTGLQNLSYANTIALRNLDELLSLSFLAGVDSLDGRMQISNCPRVKEIAGWELQRADIFRIARMDSLTRIADFAALRDVRLLEINTNLLLTIIEDMPTTRWVNGELRIYENTLWADCGADWLCAQGLGNVRFEDNATGCNSRNEVLFACSVFPPPNDNLADAIELSLAPFQDTLVLLEVAGATLETDELTCGGGDRSFWYTLTAPLTLDYDFSLEAFDISNSVNTQLAIYTGDGTHPLTEVACYDDDPAGGEEETIQLTAGETYYIRGSTPADQDPKDLLFFYRPEQNLWFGGTSSDWNEGGNWRYGRAPLAGETAVLIPAGGSDPIITDGTVAQAGFIAVASVNLTIAAGGELSATTIDMNSTASLENSGTLRVSNPGGRAVIGANVTMTDGAVLEAADTLVGTFTFMAGSTLRPAGIETGEAVFTSAIDLSGAILEIDANGSTAGSEHDRVMVPTAILTGAELVLSGTISPMAGDELVILVTDGGTTGTFFGLPEGATVSDGTNLYTISYQGGDGNDVVLTATGALPVALISFNGRAEGKHNLLQWKVASEEVFSHYELQRSTDGVSGWELLDRVFGADAGAGNGQKSYEWTDESPLPQAYYRLRSVDLDGSYTLSDVVFLQRTTSGIQLYPNPTTGAITVELPGEEPAALQVMDLNGKLLRTVNVVGGRYDARLDLPRGVYLLLATSAGDRWTSRVMVR